VSIVRLEKKELKKSAVGKIKNTEVSGGSVGLLIVHLQYGQYLGYQLSMFAIVLTLMFCLSADACTVVNRITANVLAALQRLINRSTKVQFSTTAE